MQQKTLLLYINAINGGGAERVMVNLAEKFANEGYRVILLTSFTDEWEYPLSPAVCRISMEQQEVQQNRLMRNLSRIRKLRQICKQERPDVLISFMQEPNFRAILASRGLPVKTIVSVRNDPNREYAGKVGRLVGKVLLPMADGCVFQTEDAKAWFPKRLQKKSKVIKNEVAEPFFQVQRCAARNVVTVGRLNKQKNHLLLIRAFARIADKHPEQDFLIYGEGDCREMLQQQIRKLGLESRVHLIGKTADVPGVLAKAGIFVLSSDYEGMPNALMEALAAGVPSISTDCPCGGPRALIQPGENGLLVPVGDEAALAAAMDQLLSDPEAAEKMGAAARESAKQYMPQEIFCQWRQFVTSCADK